MRNTVRIPLSERDIKDPAAAVDALNKEIRPILRQVRDALNQTTDECPSLETAATGTFTTIWSTPDLRTDSAIQLEALVLGRAPSQTCGYVVRALAYNRAGLVGFQGASTTDFSAESAAACDVQFAISGQTVVLQVKDDGANTYQWRARVSVLSSLEVAG